MSKTLVLGLGNSFRGDDGIGPAVIAALKRLDLPSDVTLIDGGTPGLETVLIWQGYQRVLIVDAAEMGIKPGAWRCFVPGEGTLLQEESAMKGTLHAAGLAEALALAEALDILPPDLVVFGVQPTSISWSANMSDAVRAVIPTLCEKLSAELVDGKPGHDPKAPF